MKLHDKLKILRLNLGMTQKQFALLMDIKDDAFYRKYESGTRIPLTVKIIALKRNNPSIDLNWLLDVDD